MLSVDNRPTRGFGPPTRRMISPVASRAHGRADRDQHVPRGGTWRRHGVHPGLVHASGGSFAARVPGDPGRRVRSSTRSRSRNSRRTSRSNRSAATASMRPCCSATSSCRPTPSDSASTSLPAPARSPNDHCAPAPTSNVCDHSRSTTSTTSSTPSDCSHAELPADGAVARLRRRPVHGGELSDRGPAEPRLPPHQGAHPHRRGAVARDHGTARRSAITFIDAQLSNGAGAFQLFDSWAGTLSRRDYDRFVLPHSRRVFDAVRERHPDAPAIHFGIGCDHLLESMHAAGPSVLGLDWRTRITDARARLGERLVVQGNLDPALVLAGADTAIAGAQRVLDDNAGAHGPDVLEPARLRPSHLQSRPRGSARRRSGCAARRRRLRPPADERAEREHDGMSRPRSRWC